MDQTFNTAECAAEDIGQLAGGSIAEAVQLEEAKGRRPEVRRAIEPL